MIPLAIVVATATLKINAPMKFPKAAISTAFLGLKTLVATTVAIEFAESWKPFTKSNIRAIAITIITKVKSGMLYHYAFNYIGHILAFVCDAFQKLIHLFVFYNVNGILEKMEQLR